MKTDASTRRVSVVVPTCDRPSTLRQALASIRALEGPDLALEIVVSDNGSDPATRIVAEQFGAVYVRAPRKGASAARNAALKAATGNYIAFLDDDDIWLPSHVRSQLAFLETHPEFDAAVGQVVTADPSLQPTSDPWPTDLPHDGDIFIPMISGYFPQIGATVARIRIRETIGLFDESLNGDEDWDWHLRLALRHRVGFVPQASVLFRQRASGSFDRLQLQRLPYTRRVFFRHAVPARRRWQSWTGFSRSYVGALRVYHNYFVDAAVERAANRRRLATLRAIWIAFSILPYQTSRALLARTPLQFAFLAAILPGSQQIKQLSVDTHRRCADQALIDSTTPGLGESAPKTSHTSSDSVQH